MNNSRPTGYDRVDTNPNNGGRTYYGYDTGYGRTDWVAEDGTLDCITDTPTENDEYQWTVDENGDRTDDW